MNRGWGENKEKVPKKKKKKQLYCQLSRTGPEEENRWHIHARYTFKLDPQLHRVTSRPSRTSGKFIISLRNVSEEELDSSLIQESYRI
jgi:hypothetical protein